MFIFHLYSYFTVDYISKLFNDNDLYKLIENQIHIGQIPKPFISKNKIKKEKRKSSIGSLGLLRPRSRSTPSQQEESTEIYQNVFE